MALRLAVREAVERAAAATGFFCTSLFSSVSVIFLVALGGGQAISSRVRPDLALLGNSSRTSPAECGRAYSSRSLIRSQFVRPRSAGRPLRRTSIQPPWSLVPSSVNFSLPARYDSSASPSAVPGSVVPDHDGAAAVFAFGDRAFELAVLQRMVFDLDGQALFRRIEAGAFWDGPAYEDAVHFEAEIVVQARGVVFLDDEAMAGARGFFGLGLGRAGEVSLLVDIHEVASELQSRLAAAIFRS